MRRIRMTTGPAALFGAMLAIALLLFLPMRIALDAFGLGEHGLTARTVSGSVWSGTLRDARFGDIALGDLDASVSPLAMLVGRGRVSLSGAGIDGAVNVSRHGLGIADMTARLATGRVFSPLPVSALDLDSLTVRFRDGQCQAAEGRVRATLSGDAGGVALPQSVSGPARCDGGALLLPLVSQAGTEGVTLRVTGNGRYTAELNLQSTDPATAQKLALLGFVQNGAGYRLSIEGSF